MIALSANLKPKPLPEKLTPESGAAAPAPMAWL
jgi:hypothetical protein